MGCNTSAPVRPRESTLSTSLTCLDGRSEVIFGDITSKTYKADDTVLSIAHPARDGEQVNAVLAALINVL